MLARKISASSAVSLGRNGRKPATSLGWAVMAKHPPLRRASSPLPLVGRGRGWGSVGVAQLCHCGTPPHPNPPPQGGREPRGARGKSSPNPSSRDLPGGAVLGVLEHHAHGSEFVADAVGFCEILGLACGGAGSDQRFDLILINLPSMPFRYFLEIHAAFINAQEVAAR